MLSPDTLLGTGDGFTLYSAHINLLLPDNVLKAQFITSSRLTQFLFLKEGYGSEASGSNLDILLPLAFIQHPTSMCYN